jgi:hypothetical protein
MIIILLWGNFSPTPTIKASAKAIRLASPQRLRWRARGFAGLRAPVLFLERDRKAPIDASKGGMVRMKLKILQISRRSVMMSCLRSEEALVRTAVKKRVASARNAAGNEVLFVCARTALDPNHLK